MIKEKGAKDSRSQGFKGFFKKGTTLKKEYLLQRNLQHFMRNYT